MEFKFRSSLHPSCHHHVTFEKFNLRIHYPPPYGILPPPRKTGGQFYWTLGDLKYSPTSRGLSPMAGLKFSTLFFRRGGGGADVCWRAKDEFKFSIENIFFQIV